MNNSNGMSQARAVERETQGADTTSNNWYTARSIERERKIRVNKIIQFEKERDTKRAKGESTLLLDHHIKILKTLMQDPVSEEDRERQAVMDAQREESERKESERKKAAKIEIDPIIRSVLVKE